MTKRWPIKGSGKRIAELVEAARSSPQLITGEKDSPVAVVLSYEEFERFSLAVDRLRALWKRREGSGVAPSGESGGSRD